jgi:hypothetical protein
VSAHPQTWVKVNAQVDVNLSEIVSILNSINGLETLQSCQGESGRENAYIYFSFGGWQNLCGFIFERMAPNLRPFLGEDIKLEVIAADERPFAKMSFSAEAIPQVTSALKEVVRV